MHVQHNYLIALVFRILHIKSHVGRVDAPAHHVRLTRNDLQRGGIDVRHNRDLQPVDIGQLLAPLVYFPIVGISLHHSLRLTHLRQDVRAKCRKARFMLAVTTVENAVQAVPLTSFESMLVEQRRQLIRIGEVAMELLQVIAVGKTVRTAPVCEEAGPTAIGRVVCDLESVPVDHLQHPDIAGRRVARTPGATDNWRESLVMQDIIPEELNVLGVKVSAVRKFHAFAHVESEFLIVGTDLQVEDVASHRGKVMRNILGFHPGLVRDPAGVMANRAGVEV